MNYDLPGVGNKEVELDLVPCPFCGSTDGLALSSDIKDGRVTASGKIQRHPALRMGVVCWHCGANGPSCNWYGDARVALLPSLEVEEQQALIAATLWNGRSSEAVALGDMLLAVVGQARTLLTEHYQNKTTVETAK